MAPKNRFVARREYAENVLISCAREKENQLVRAKNLSVERWFYSRFFTSKSYFILGNEFRMMEKKWGNWETTSLRQENSFVRTATGGGNMRRITVNANIVGGGEWPTYVACEGPTQESVYDFWTLVWQEGVNRILSVNFPYEERLYDQAYAKETAQYWPIIEGETVHYMPYKLICTESRMMSAVGIVAATNEEMVYRITRLTMCLENNILNEKSTRDIIHMCYYRWPDARIPIPWACNKTSRQAAISLIMAIEKEIRDTDAPLLVHCHAGIGRTGVIISTDMALRQLRNTHTVNIKEVVEQLRLKRPRSVMNPWQYALIHLIVAEVAAKEQLLPSIIDSQPVDSILNGMWADVDEEVKAYFGDEVVTYEPELMKT